MTKKKSGYLIGDWKAAEVFLTTIFSGCPTDQFLEIRCIGPGKLGYVKNKLYKLDSDPFTKAVKFATTQNARDYNVYYGPSSRRTGENGTRANTGLSRASYVDIDCGAGDVNRQPGVRKFSTKEEARQALDELVANGALPPPTFIVDTGNGLHVYWIHNEFRDVSDLPKWRKVMVKLALLLRGDMKIPDGPEGVMRLPGSLNTKDPSDKKPALIVGGTGEPVEADSLPQCRDDELVGRKAKRKAKRKARPASPRRREVQRVPADHYRLVSALQKEGVIAKELFDDNGFIGSRLDLCPFCGNVPSKHGGQSKWSATISPHRLSLACFRSDCTARGRQVQLEEWLPELYPTVAEELWTLLPQRLTSVMGWLKSTWLLMSGLADDGYVCVLAAPTGSGKTEFFIVVLLVDARHQKPSTLSLPTYELAEEVVERMGQSDAASGIQVRLIKSLSRICRYKDQLAAWGRHLRGWARTMCPKCPDRTTCQYHTQLEGLTDKRVLVTVHDNLRLLQNRGLIGDLLVVDEVGQGAEKVLEWSVTDLRAILKNSSPWAVALKPAVRLLVAVLERARIALTKRLNDDAEIMETEVDSPGGCYLYGPELHKLVEETAAEVGAKSTVLRPPTNSARPPRVPRRQILDGAPEDMPPVDVDELLTNLDQSAIHFASPTEYPTFRLFRLGFRGLEARVVCLDATAWEQRAMIESVFAGRKVEFFTLRMEAPSHCSYLHYRTTTYQATRIRKERYRVGRALRSDAKVIAQEIRDWAAKASEKATVGIIAPKKIRDAAVEAFTAAGLDVIGSGHFGALRGLNTLQDVGALVVLGDLHPNIRQAAYQAHVLGIDTDTRIWGIRRAEAVQAVGRARAIRRGPENPLLIVHASTKWLLEPEPNKIIDGAGKPPGYERTAMEDIAQGIFEATGFAAAPLLPRIFLSATREGLRQALLNLYTSNHLCRTPGEPVPTIPKSTARTAQRVTSKLAKTKEAVAIRVALPWGGGTMVVWEVTPGSYAAFMREVERATCALAISSPKKSGVTAGPGPQLTLLDEMECLTEQLLQDNVSVAPGLTRKRRNLLEVCRQSAEYYERLEARCARPLGRTQCGEWRQLRERYDRIAAALAEREAA